MILLRLSALALTALVLVPNGAHFFELPGKMQLGRDAYFTVQSIYAGWAWFGVPIFAAIGLNGALSFAERRHDPTAAAAAAVAAALIAISLAIFFAFVFPGNQATANWTSVPDDWQALRMRWEYGHATNAIVSFAALIATGRAIMSSRRA